MVFSAEAVPRPSEDSSSPVSAAMQLDERREAARGGLLHQLSFPISKTWGKQRVLRCMSANGMGEGADGGPYRRSPPDAADDGKDVRIKEVKEKLLVHLREAAQRIERLFPPPPPLTQGRGEREEEADREAEADAEPPSSAAARPWNLRTKRRRGPRAPSPFERQSTVSPPAPAAAAEKRPVRRRLGSTELAERPKFSVTLTGEEIDEDIYAVTGHRARRRPRKRPRVVQKQLDLLFPGSWLTEITTDSYRVSE